MSLISVFTDHIRHDQTRRYEAQISRLAGRARKKKEEWHWTAHQVGFGALGRIHYVSWHADYADLEKHGDPQALFTRVLGKKKGEEALETASACLWSNERGLGLQRPELSYPAERREGVAPVTSVARLRAKPGGQEILEDLLGKIAEAIPKTGESARIGAVQAVTGDMLGYWLVRPLESLAALDQQSIGRDLLVKAYGKTEGDELFRRGNEATERLEREILFYREDLSNPER